MNSKIKYNPLLFIRLFLLFFMITGSCQFAFAQDDTLKNGEHKQESYFWEKWRYTDPPDPLQLRRIPDSLTNDLKKKKAFWYANAKLKKANPRDNNGKVPLLLQKWFQVLLWLVIIGGFAVFLMIYLSGSSVGLFRANKKVITYDENEEELENIFAINYQKEIDRALALKNYRLSIRLMFLRLLRTMSDKKIIQYKQERTNMDYLQQLHSTPYYNDFLRLARNYEYSWYGQFDISESVYSIISTDFSKFDRQLG